MPNGLRRTHPWEEFSAPVEEPTYTPLTVDEFASPVPEDQRAPAYTEQQDFKRGLHSSFRSLEAGGLHRRADILESEGRIEKANQVRAEAHQYDAAAAKLRPRVASHAEATGVGDTVDFLQGGFGQLLPTMGPPLVAGLAGTVGGAMVGGPVGAYLGGTAAASVPAFQMEAGEQASSQQADPYIRDNTTAEERLYEQNVKGAQNAVLESLFPAVFGGRLVTGAARRIAGEALKKGPLRRTLAVGREGALESGTEFTQTLTGQASLSRLNPNRDTSHDYIEQIDSAILGALGGTSMSLGTTVPGYLTERVNTRLGQAADEGARDLGRAAGELQLRAIQRMADRGEQAGVDIPLRPSMMISNEMLDEQDRAEFQDLVRRFQQAETAGDEALMEGVVNETEEFFFNKHPQWKPVAEGISARDVINEGGGGDTLRLNQTTQEPTAPDINMMPDRPVPMFPSTGSAGAAKFRRRHILTGKNPEGFQAKAAVRKQLQVWKNQGFLSQSGVDAAQAVPLGQWLEESNASEEEVQAEADTMLRDLDSRLKGAKGDNRQSLLEQKAALESAETYGDYFEVLNEYSVLQFPPSEIEGNFTPHDADMQRRSVELVTGKNLAEKRANRKQLMDDEGIRVKLRVGGHKNGRVIIKRDVIAHARNFFREELSSFPDGPARDEAALLMGVFSDPRVKSLLHNGKEITQDDILGRGEDQGADYRRRLENPEHRAALKLKPLTKSPRRFAPKAAALHERAAESRESSETGYTGADRDQTLRQYEDPETGELTTPEDTTPQPKSALGQRLGEMDTRIEEMAAELTRLGKIPRTRNSATYRKLQKDIAAEKDRLKAFEKEHAKHPVARERRLLATLNGVNKRLSKVNEGTKGHKILLEKRRKLLGELRSIDREAAREEAVGATGMATLGEGPYYALFDTLEMQRATEEMQADPRLTVDQALRRAVHQERNLIPDVASEAAGTVVPVQQQRGEELIEPAQEYDVEDFDKAQQEIKEIEDLTIQRRQAEERLANATTPQAKRRINNQINRLTSKLRRKQDVFGSMPSYNTLEHGPDIGSKEPITQSPVTVPRGTHGPIVTRRPKAPPVRGDLKSSLQVSPNGAFNEGTWQWSGAPEGKVVRADTYEGLCIGCANGNVNRLRAQGLPAVKTEFRHLLPGTKDFFSPHFFALTKAADGKYYIVDDPQKNLYKVSGKDKIEVLKGQYEPTFIELTTANLKKHYGITKAEAEEQYSGLSEGMRKVLPADFVRDFFAERNVTPGQGYAGLINSLKADLDRQIAREEGQTLKPSKMVPKEQAANDIILGKWAKSLKKYGYTIAEDPESGEIYLTDKDGKRVDPKGQAKKALNDMPRDLRYETLEEAMRDPDIQTRVDAAKRWLIRAFGPEIMSEDRLGWMLAREAPGMPMAGFYTKEMVDSAGKLYEDFIGLAADSVDPLSTAFHEGMHKFVQKLEDSGNQDLYNRMVKAATAPHVMKQMEKMLADYPTAIADMRAKPEEAVAYAFQFYAASRNGGVKFNIQPSLKEFFQRIIHSLGRMLGIMTHARASTEIFDALFEGRVQRDGIEPLRKYQERSFQEYAKDVMDGIRRSVPRALSSPIIQLQNQRNANGDPIPAFIALANAWHSEPLKGGETGLIYRNSQMEGQFRNRWHKILTDNSATEAEMDEALLNMQSMKEPTTQLEKDLQKFFQRMYTYQFERGANPVKVLKVVDEETGRKEWVTPDKVKNYWPRIWSTEQILANEIEFREVMAEEGRMSDEAITNFIDMLQATNGLEAGSELQKYGAEFSPYNAAINARVFDFINEGNAHRFAKFQEQNMAKVMDRYIRQAVHRREHSRTFGHNGAVIKDLMLRAKRDGATDQQLQYAEKVVQGLEGRLGTDKVSDAAREAMVASMSITNFAVLAMATLSSMVDPLGVMVRTGSLKAATNTFKSGFKQIIADARKQKVPDQELTEYLGIIEDDMVQDMLNNMERGIYMNEKLRKMNKFFFKSIGLEQWTRGTRIGATRAAMEYLKKNANNADALAELGLELGAVQEVDDRIALKPGEFQDGDQIEQARKMQNAVFRMVDESVLRPTAATRPLWASDMRFRLLGHLKSYTFTFHNQILRQVMTRAKTSDNLAQSAMAITPLLAYVPIMLAADMARDMLQGDDRDRDLDETVYRAIQRSAILGMGTFLMDIDDEMDWGGLPTNTMLGPVIDSSLNLGRAAVNPDASFLNAGAKLLPYNALWRKWGDEEP